MTGKASFVLDYVNRRLSSDSIEVGYYLKAIEDLYTMQFGFKDVQMFFLKPNISVLFNLIGLHYCMVCLNVPVSFAVPIFVLSYVQVKSEEHKLVSILLVLLG